MELKTVQRICYAFIGLISVLLFLLMFVKQVFFGYAAIAVIIVYAVFNIAFWRCPACGKCLGQLGKQSFCRFCGEELDL